MNGLEVTSLGTGHDRHFVSALQYLQRLGSPWHGDILCLDILQVQEVPSFPEAADLLTGIAPVFQEVPETPGMDEQVLPVLLFGDGDTTITHHLPYRPVIILFRIDQNTIVVP